MSLQPFSIPKDGFAGTGGAAKFASVTTSTTNVSVAEFSVGTKIRYENETIGGFGTCIYLKYSDGAGTVTIGTGDAVKATVNAGEVTADVTSQHTSGATAIAIGTVDDGNFGWFWCGGVAPDLFTAAAIKLAIATGASSDVNSATTDGTVTAAANIITASADKTIKIATATDLVSPMGFSSLADTGNVLGLVSITLYDNWG